MLIKVVDDSTRHLILVITSLLPWFSSVKENFDTTTTFAQKIAAPGGVMVSQW